MCHGDIKRSGGEINKQNKLKPNLNETSVSVPNSTVLFVHSLAISSSGNSLWASYDPQNSSTSLKNMN